MRKRVIISVLLLITLISGFIFILDESNKNHDRFEPKKRINNRTNVPINFITAKAISFEEEVSRLLPYKDSAIMFTDTIIYIVSKELSFKREVLVPFKEFLHCRYLYMNDAFFAGLNFNPNSLYIGDSSLNSTVNGVYFSNAIYCEQKMYVNKTDLKDDVYSIGSWSPVSGSYQNLLDFKHFLKQELSFCKECFSETLEGNFFRIDGNRFGYYFYRGGYFIVYNQGEFKLKKTIVDYPFLVFTEKSVKLPGGTTGYQCSPERDVWVQMAACSDGKFIFILSNVTKEGLKERVIDTYSADSLEYIKSYSLPDYKDGKPNEILFVAGQLLVAYDNNLLVSYTVEEK